MENNRKYVIQFVFILVGLIYCINRAGEVLVLKAAPTYELVGIYPLGEPSQATPAVAGGKMYLRTFSQLISIGGK